MSRSVAGLDAISRLRCTVFCQVPKHVSFWLAISGTKYKDVEVLDCPSALGTWVHVHGLSLPLSFLSLSPIPRIELARRPP